MAQYIRTNLRLSGGIPFLFITRAIRSMTIIDMIMCFFTEAHFCVLREFSLKNRLRREKTLSTAARYLRFIRSFTARMSLLFSAWITCLIWIPYLSNVCCPGTAMSSSWVPDGLSYLMKKRRIAVLIFFHILFRLGFIAEYSSAFRIT